MMTTSAWADTSSMNTDLTGMGVLENDYVKAGVNGDTGTFGSGGNTSPGLLFDSSGTGTFNTSYDYLTPGSPFDGWSIKIDGTNYTNNNASTGSETWTDSDGLSDGDGTLTWQGTNSDLSGWQVEHVYSLGATSQYIDITTNITAGSSASDSTVYFGRFIDPDARAADGDSSATDNVLGYSGIPDSNVAFSEATTSRYALGLYSTNSNVDAGITGWTTDADSYTDSKYTDSDGNTVNYGTGDDTIGLTWVWTGVEAGDILTADYSYIFGPSAFDAADEAIESGAGGGTAGETPESWGTVEDVGSATEAAESGGSPTVTGTATSSLTRHTATEADGVQTVGRVKTTSTWDVYSDGTTGTASATTETLTPFTGRIDQHNKMTAIGTSINRNMHVNPWQTGGAQAQWGRMWITGDYGKTSMDNGYDADTKGYGAQVEFQFMPEWRVSVGVAKSTTDLTGTDSASTMDKINVNIGSIFEMDKFIFATDIGAAKNDYTSARTISTYANASETSGRDIMAKQRVYYKLSDSIIPFVGAGITKTTRDGFTESGWIVSARTVEAVDEINKYAEGGMRLQHSFGDLNLYAQGSYTTDKIKTGSVGAGYQIAENASINIGATISDQDEARHTSGRLSVNIKF
jgi:hypothetical protein